MSASLSPDPWHAHLRLCAADAPYRYWLAGEDSLTARIRAHCMHFSVQVWRQRLLAPHADETRLLGCAPREWVWTREVVLRADGRPVVFAHSVLAQRHARGHWQMFAQLGARPLGAALFADPRIQRAPLRYRQLDVRHPLYRAAAHALAPAVANALPPRLWARRSLFRRGGQALLVSEVFLPEILHL